MIVVWLYLCRLFIINGGATDEDMRMLNKIIDKEIETRGEEITIEEIYIEFLNLKA
jgi:hypothetical protein